MFDADFLTRTPAARHAYRAAIDAAAATLLRALPAGPCSGRSAAALHPGLATELAPRHGHGLAAALRQAETIVADSVFVGHPDVAAHLHCPPLLSALAAEVVLTALNQSMDSFDQAPAATVIEQQIIDWLCAVAGLPAGAGGSFTAGGTQSNYMGLLLARDAWLARQGWSVRDNGLPPDHRNLAIVCSELAHFTIEKSAIQLGLGTGAIVTVPVDPQFRMDVRALEQTVAQLRSDGRRVMAIVATAGTTDFGSIDPLPAVGHVAGRAGAWFHVDAAYGGALLVSRLRSLALSGLDLADSISLDGHKLLWQSISCGMFLVRDAETFDLINTRADYLNPESHEADGVPDLVNRSVLTTRRFDAFKLWLTLQTHGVDGLSAMIDRVLDLTRQTAALLGASTDFELLTPTPALSCVVFRYRGGDDEAEADALNERIRRELFTRGEAVVGGTRLHGRACLKLTLLNPTVEFADIEQLVARLARTGAALRAPAGALSVQP